MKKFIPFAMAATLVLGACGGGGTQYTENDVKGAIAAAEHELSRASKKGHAWRDTGKMIKQAKKLLKEGELEKAITLANKAKRQSSNALAQAAEQENMKRDF